MKNYFLSLIFLLPFSLLGQLDKLQPGMKQTEFHKNFPTATEDLISMTSVIYRTDTLLGIIGESRYVAVKDSVNKYGFRSVPALGPNEVFPKADSVEFLRLIRAAEELTGHYTDIFGVPTVHGYVNPRIKGTGNCFVANWKRPDANISIIVHQDFVVDNVINAPVTDTKEKKKKGVNYVLEIFAEGKWTKLRIEFEIGINKLQFRALMPALASQVKDFPECWMMKDSLGGKSAEWHFWFIENILAGYSYDSYGGDAYGGTNKEMYPAFLKKAKMFVAEEKRSYGDPTLLQEPPTDNYTEIKKIPNAFFYDNIYYNAEWEMDKGKTLVVRLHENGGKGESFLHLEVYFGAKKD